MRWDGVLLGVGVPVNGLSKDLTYLALWMWVYNLNLAFIAETLDETVIKYMYIHLHVERVNFP